MCCIRIQFLKVFFFFIAKLNIETLQVYMEEVAVTFWLSLGSQRFLQYLRILFKSQQSSGGVSIQKLSLL